MTRGRKFDATQGLGVGGRGGCKNFDASVADWHRGWEAVARRNQVSGTAERRVRRFPNVSPEILASLPGINTLPLVCTYRSASLCVQGGGGFARGDRPSRTTRLHASSSSFFVRFLRPRCRERATVPQGHFFRRDSRSSDASRRGSARILARMQLKIRRYAAVFARRFRRRLIMGPRPPSDKTARHLTAIEDR